MQKSLVSIFIIFALHSAMGCVSPRVYMPHNLTEKILKPRKGFDGKLTNRYCKKYDGQKCSDAVIDTFDINDQKFRLKINKLNFICNISGKRFKICKDKPGFCRFYGQKKDCFLFFCKEKPLLQEYLPIKNNYQFLIDANARCFNRTKYPFGGLNEF